MFSNNTSSWKRTSQRKKHQLDEASKIPSSGLILRSFPGNVVEILINIVVALFDWPSCRSSTSPPPDLPVRNSFHTPIVLAKYPTRALPKIQKKF